MSLPEALRGVDQQALEAYVAKQFRRMAMSLAGQLRPGVTEEELNQALAVASRALHSSDDVQEAAGPAQLSLRFRHNCKFLGCTAPECALCKNNPCKRCTADDNFHREFADHQALKSRCDAPVDVELYDHATRQASIMPGIEIQLSIIDGEAYVEGSPHGAFATTNELLQSDDGAPLLGYNGTNGQVLADGHIILKLQGGRAPLGTDLHVADKTDTFRMNNSAYGSFRLLAVAVQRTALGQLEVVESIAPAVSDKFVVKTQRAVNDYNKSDYPHYKDPFTKIKFVGNTTLTKLKDAQACLGHKVPFSSVQTVDELRQLVEYADKHKEVEAALLELFKFRGRHKQRYDIVRGVLFERVVYDDSVARVWYTDDNVNGLMFGCKQAQINFDKPAGLVQRVMQNGGVRVLVTPLTDAASQATARAMKVLAEAAWHTPGHPGWQLLAEPHDYRSSSSAPSVSGATVSVSGNAAASPLASSGGNAMLGAAPRGMHGGLRAPRSAPGVITEGYDLDANGEELQPQMSDPGRGSMGASGGSFVSATNRVITSGSSRDHNFTHQALRQVRSTPEQGAPAFPYPHLGGATNGGFGVQEPPPLRAISGLSEEEVAGLLNAESTDLENLHLSDLRVDSGASTAGSANASSGDAAAGAGCGGGVGGAPVGTQGAPKRLRSKTDREKEAAAQPQQGGSTKAFYHLPSFGRHTPRPRPTGDVSDQSARQPTISETEPLDQHRQELINELGAVVASTGVGLAVAPQGIEVPMDALQHVLYEPLDSLLAAGLGPGIVSANFKDLLALEPLTTNELEQALSDTAGLRSRLLQRRESDSFRHLLLNICSDSFRHIDSPDQEQ